MSNIGKKVRIITDYIGYEGKIGTIKEEIVSNSGRPYFIVKLENGAEVQPNTPEDIRPQCEFVEETAPKAFHITGKQHHLDAMKVDLKELLGYNFSGYFNQQAITSNFNRAKSLEYFLNLTCIETINLENRVVFHLPEQYNEALSHAAAGVQWWKNKEQSFNAGDYVMLLGDISGFPVKGLVVKIVKQNETISDRKLRYFVDYKVGSSNLSVLATNLRKANAEEISRYRKPGSKKITIGSKSIVAEVFKDKVDIRTASITIAEVEELTSLMKSATGKDIGAWQTHIDQNIRFLRIGCQDEMNLFSISDLRYIIHTAKTL